MKALVKQRSRRRLHEGVCVCVCDAVWQKLSQALRLGWAGVVVRMSMANSAQVEEDEGRKETTMKEAERDTTRVQFNPQDAGKGRNGKSSSHRLTGVDNVLFVVGRRRDVWPMRKLRLGHRREQRCLCRPRETKHRLCLSVDFAHPRIRMNCFVTLPVIAGNNYGEWMCKNLPGARELNAAALKITAVVCCSAKIPRHINVWREVRQALHRRKVCGKTAFAFQPKPLRFSPISPGEASPLENCPQPPLYTGV